MGPTPLKSGQGQPVAGSRGRSKQMSLESTQQVSWGVMMERCE